MTQSLSVFLRQERDTVNTNLIAFVQSMNAPQFLKDAIVYSIKAGGKRLRPILLLAVIEAFGKDRDLGFAPACALEMIHTYSLIHDDLPAMDDDDLRRGQPTNHKMFGEATATLAGDALLTYSFECLANEDQLSPILRTQLVSGLAHAAGPAGMVGGQSDDLSAEGRVLTLEELESIHQRKTGRLLAFAVEAGAKIAGAAYEQQKALMSYARYIGLAFQIRDDILDVEGEEGILGKSVGSDVTNEKSTYPKLLGLEETKIKLDHYIEKALHSLQEANVPFPRRLQELAYYIVERNY